MVAGVGLEPHDLRVMSPTSYQLLYPAILNFRRIGAGDRDRTGTRLSSHRILSPMRLPVPPRRHFSGPPDYYTHPHAFVNTIFKFLKNKNFCALFIEYLRMRRIFRTHPQQNHVSKYNQKSFNTLPIST